MLSFSPACQPVRQKKKRDKRFRVDGLTMNGGCRKAKQATATVHVPVSKQRQHPPAARRHGRCGQSRQSPRRVPWRNCRWLAMANCRHPAMGVPFSSVHSKCSCLLIVDVACLRTEQVNTRVVWGVDTHSNTSDCVPGVALHVVVCLNGAPNNQLLFRHFSGQTSRKKTKKYQWDG